MTYIVSWTRAALQDYLDLAATATDPDAVDAASLRIDAELETDGHEKGESRVGRVRILFQPPLAVLFTADEIVGVAFVLRAAWSGHPA